MDGAGDVKKLYRACVDAARKLDALNKRLGADAAFAPDALVARQRILDSCDRLIFRHCLDYGRQAEDMVWKKCFYETLQLYRSRKESLTDQQLSAGRTFIQLAAGYYHGYIQRCVAKLAHSQDARMRQWSKVAVYKAYVYLGDLARYSIDLDEGGFEDPTKLAQIYYLSAAKQSPKQGMPYNQLGTLFGTRHHGVESLAYYFKCLLSDEPFDGAERNMGLIFAKAQTGLQTAQLNEDVFLLGTVTLIGGAVNAAVKKEEGHTPPTPLVEQWDGAWRAAVASLSPNFTTSIAGKGARHNNNSGNNRHRWQVGVAKRAVKAMLMCDEFVMRRMKGIDSAHANRWMGRLLCLHLRSTAEHLAALLAGVVPTNDVTLKGHALLNDMHVRNEAGGGQNEDENEAFSMRNGPKLEGGPSGDSGVCSPSPLHVASQRDTPDPPPASNPSSKPPAPADPPPLSTINQSHAKEEDHQAQTNHQRKRRPPPFLRRRRRASNSGMETDEEEEEDGEGGRKIGVEMSEDENDSVEEAESDKETDANGEADVVIMSDTSSSNGKPVPNDNDIVVESVEAALKENPAVLEEKSQNLEEHEDEEDEDNEDEDEEKDGENVADVEEEDENEEEDEANDCVDRFRALPDARRREILAGVQPLLSLVAMHCNWLTAKNDEEKTGRLADLAEPVAAALGNLCNFLPMDESDGDEQTGFDGKGVNVDEVLFGDEDANENPIVTIRHTCTLLSAAFPNRLRFDAASTRFLSADAAAAGEERRRRLERRRLMRSMGRLRVQTELSRLSATAWLPAYLVPDGSALLRKLPAVKRLAEARNENGGPAFLLVVPKAVVSELDVLKKDSAQLGLAARHAFRWLEENVERGVHNVREQRPDELEDAQIGNGPEAQCDATAHLCRRLASSLLRVDAHHADKSGADRRKRPHALAAVLTAAVFGNDQFNRTQKAVDELAGGQDKGVTVENASRFLSRWDRHAKRRQRKKAG